MRFKVYLLLGLKTAHELFILFQLEKGINSLAESVRCEFAYSAVEVNSFFKIGLSNVGYLSHQPMTESDFFNLFMNFKNHAFLT